MAIKFTDVIEADVVVTVRRDGNGPLVAKAAASCEYAPGATSSADVDLPPEVCSKIEAIIEAALPKVEEELGRKLAQSRHEAARVAATMGDPVGQVAGKVKPAKRGRK